MTKRMIPDTNTRNACKCDECIYLYHETGLGGLCAAADRALFLYNGERGYYCTAQTIRCETCSGTGMVGLDGDAPLAECTKCGGRGTISG